MQSLCLDTDIIVGFLRNSKNRELFEKIEKNTIQGFISSVTLFELYYGALLSPKSKEALDDIRKISSWLETIDVNNNVAFITAKILSSLKKKGEIIDIRDALIAASAISRNIPLATENKKHYSKINGIELYD
jgi:predicted nucleic acid-binding protein